MGTRIGHPRSGLAQRRPRRRSDPQGQAHVGARELDVPVGKYLGYVAWKPTLGVLPGLGLLVWFKWGLHVETPLAVIGSGVIYTILFALIQVFYVYRRDPYTDPLALIQAKRAQS